MWWINRNGVVEGPLSAGQIEKRVKLNMLRSLDRVSEDKTNWFYVKDTAFWNPTRTLEDPVPPRPPRRMPEDLQKGGNFDGATLPPLPERLRLDTPVAKPPLNKGLRIALASLIVVSVASVGLVVCLLMRNSTAQATADHAPTAEGEKPALSVGFGAVKDKLIIIECDEGSGSGFLLAMDGKTYLVTNEHVVRSAGTPRARRLDGTPLDLGSFSVATDRDLARFEVVGCSVKPFETSDSLPNTGDVVVMYGNSLGGGVATESKGFIQGVGPHRLETNNEIVPGNSGSPLVGADGKVLGVAAFVDRHGSEEWTVKNTRYEGTPRRFAVRLTNVSWKPVDRRRYERQIATLKEYETYWEYLLPYLCLDTIDVDEGKLVFNDMKSRDFKLKKYGYVEMLTVLTKAYKKRNKRLDQWSTHRRTTEMFEKVKEAFRDMILKRKEALQIARSVLAESDWDAPQVLNGYSKDDRRGSVEWYLEGVQYFMDLMNQKLKDLNKEIESIEKGDGDEDDE